MLLKLFRARIGSAAERGRDEGVAMAAVIGLMAVAAVVVVTLMSATVFSAGVTGATRSSVQAKAAAEAGVDAAAALFQASGCTTIVPAGTNPTYTVQVFSGNATNQSTPGCTGGDYKRVVSTGTASSAAVAGNATGQKRTMEAVFYLPSASAPSPGYAILGGAGFSATNEFTVTASGDVYVSTGNFNCSVGGSIDGSLFVPEGTAYLTNGCKVKGDVYARDGVEINSNAQVGGNAISPNGYFKMSGGGADAIGSRPWLAGNAQAGGDVTINVGTVLGSVTSSNGTGSIAAGSRIVGDFRVAKALAVNGAFTVGGMLTSSSGTSTSWGAYTVGSMRVAGLSSFQGGTRVLGDLIITSASASTSVGPDVTIDGVLRSAGEFSSWGSGPRVSGAYVSPSTLASATGGYAKVSGQVAAPVPAAPEVQAGVAFPRVTYKPADWAAQGFTQEVWPSGSSCHDTNVSHWMSEKFSSYGTATVVDTRAACPTGLKWDNSQRIKLHANVAIIATSITTTNDFLIESGDGSTHTAWMIVPAAETGPLCPSGSGSIDFSVGHGSAMPLMIYGACGVKLSNEQTFPGQVWGATLTISNKTTVNYTPIGIPGVTLTPGGTPTPTIPATLDLLSKRDTTS